MKILWNCSSGVVISLREMLEKTGQPTQYRDPEHLSLILSSHLSFSAVEARARAGSENHLPQNSWNWAHVGKTCAGFPPEFTRFARFIRRADEKWWERECFHLRQFVTGERRVNPYPPLPLPLIAENRVIINISRRKPGVEQWERLRELEGSGEVFYLPRRKVYAYVIKNVLSGRYTTRSDN